MFLRTLGAGALTAAVVALRVDLAWAGVFAIGVLIGTLNWFFLANLLISFTGKQPGAALGWLGGKLALLGVMLVVVLPAIMGEIGAYLAGFHLFIVMAVLDAAGSILAAKLRAADAGAERQLPRNIRTLLSGKVTDA